MDWEALQEHEQGLFEFQTAAAIKLRTEADIVVGELEVPAGNVSPGFAGLYSLWLRLDDDGQWVLIVNHEPDVWGTMHDPAKDLGSTPLEHSVVEDGKSRLTIDIEPPEGDAPGARSSCPGANTAPLAKKGSSHRAERGRATVQVVVDVLESVAWEREDEDQRFGAGATKGVCGVGRNVDGRSRANLLRVSSISMRPLPLST